MSGLNLQTGLTGSVVGGLYGPGSGASAVAPTRTAVPEGPTTVAAAAYGGGSDAGGSNSGVHSCVIGALSIAVLVFMWWSLPRLPRGVAHAPGIPGRGHRRRCRRVGLAQVREPAAGW